MNFQRIVAGVLVLLIAALAGAFYMNWKTLGQLRTMKAFVEGYVFAEAGVETTQTQAKTLEELVNGLLEAKGGNAADKS